MHYRILQVGDPWKKYTLYYRPNVFKIGYEDVSKNSKGMQKVAYCYFALTNMRIKVSK